MAKKVEVITNGETVNGKDNPAFTSDADTNVATIGTNITNTMQISEAPKADKKGFLAEFFDLSLTIDLFKILIKKRDNNKRMVLYLLICCYFVFFASLGENDFIYLFLR